MSTINKYIVLQSSNRSGGLREPFAGPRMSRVAPLARERFAPAINLSVETLSTQDIAEVRRSPDVVSIAPVMQVKLIAPLEKQEVNSVDGPGATWGVTVTGAANSSYTGNGVVVAVLDTGIDDNHEAFNGVQLIQEDFTGTGLGDLNGHGTHVAGTIFGRSNNGYRFGVAPGVKKAVIGKVFDESGSGTTDGIYRAILWAADQGASIVSMSLGFSFKPVWDYYINEGWPEDLALDRALEAYRANIRLFDSLAALIYDRAGIFNSTLLVAAAGNESKRDVNPDYELTVAPPAAADGVVSVGALRTAGGVHDNLTVADFSNTGPDIMAPGVDIYSAKTGGGYISLSGTSMATPHVAGVAALWAEKLLNETGYINSEALSARLIGQASRSSLAAGFDPFDVGEGLVQAPL